ncbi:MAG: hypothetical protein G8237_03140 [Magnetococcales bacterium]|nr:hypothetical protein [Magnetococcales bacterium]NGZ05330.1 hypothetical protein [Magnetococcales bacterium]
MRGHLWVVGGLMGWLVLAIPVDGLAEACRMGFDVGSSGIRVGSTVNDAQAKVAIDYLGDVWPDQEINQTVEATIEALRTLPGNAGVLSGECRGVAGGYSAWRLALQNGDPQRLIATLGQIHAQTGVPLFVIPQDVEGIHGHRAASNVLGAQLRTPFILDLGGGSVQIASTSLGWGADLGQKSWRKLFCARIKQSPDPNCAPNPVGVAARAETGRVLATRLAAARQRLGSGIRMTAISAPVVKTIHPVLRHLALVHGLVPSDSVDEHGFQRVALTAAVEQLAPLDDAALTTLLADPQKPVCEARFLPALVTDMLLVEALMTALEVERMEVAYASTSNVSGLLADPQARAWADHYPCYLRKLAEMGVDAYHADPAVSCAVEEGHQPTR